MITAISQMLTAFGLSSASGLNAYIPLLTVALIARFTDWIKLGQPFDMLTNEYCYRRVGRVAGNRNDHR